LAKEKGPESLAILSRQYRGSRKPIRLGFACYECNPWRVGFSVELEPNCEKCQHEMPWFEKLWICGCKCNDDWVPQQVGDPEFDPPAAKKKRHVEKPVEPEDEPAGDNAEDES
jgi:hypothetical protein